MRPHRRALAAGVLAAALALPACSSSGSNAGLADTVRAQGEAQDALRQRIGDVENQVSAVLSRDDITDFRTMSETVAAIEARLEELSGELATLGTESEDRAAASDAAVAQLASDVEGLRAAVASLDAELQQLREDHESLLRQFTTHRSDDSRHR